MKRSSLKTVFSAFAFTLAIVASFAFFPVNGAEDDPVNGYIQVVSPKVDCEKVTHGCVLGLGVDCTITLIDGEVAVFYTKTGTTCSVKLTKPPY